MSGNFALILSELMTRYNVSNYRLALDLGISKSTIANYLDGTTEPQASIRSQILDYFRKKETENTEKTGKQYKTAKSESIVSEDNFAYKLTETKGIPIYNIPATGGGIEIYTSMINQKPEGYVHIPGFEDCHFCIPVWGHSMYPTFENGSYVIGKWITNPESIAWGECYYVEWEDYRMIKRLIVGEGDDDVLLYSDNDKELIRGRPKYAPIKIKKSEIRKIALIKGVHKKLNH